MTEKLNLNVIKNMLLEGKCAAEISRELECGYSKLYSFIIKNNLGRYIDVQHNGKAPLQRKWQTEQVTFKISKKELEDLYHKQKLNMYQIAKNYNVSAASVHNRMRKFNIKSRSKSEAMSMITSETREKHRTNANKGIIGVFKTGKGYKNTNIERSFISWAKSHNLNYIGQFQIVSGTHNYDFLIENTKILVETDGEYWHNTPKQKQKDNEFEIFAIEHGYRVYRFTDKDIRKTKGKCFDFLLEIIEGEKTK